MLFSRNPLFLLAEQTLFSPEEEKMNFTLHKVIKLQGFLAAILGIFLVTTGIMAEELSDFEKLLQEAIRNNQTGNQSAPQVRKAANAKTVQRDPNKLVPDANAKNAPKKVVPGLGNIRCSKIGNGTHLS